MRKCGILPTDTLQAAIEEMGKEFVINAGDGAFYGPKLDFHLADSLGRTWQCGTIQLDFQMPERFDLEYVGEDGQKHRPVMIHRALLGSIERFIGVITEHFAGAFPTWLAPVQIKVLPITDRTHAYAQEVMEQPGRPRASALRAGLAAAKRSATRSGRPSWKKCLICWCWATRNKRRAKWPCATAKTARPRSWAWMNSWPRSGKKSTPKPCNTGKA